LSKLAICKTFDRRPPFTTVAIKASNYVIILHCVGKNTTKEKTEVLILIKYTFLAN